MGGVQEPLEQLLADIRACQSCARHFPHGARPVVQMGGRARLQIVGQAPGRKVHASGTPWDDASGQKLRRWLGLTDEEFYDASKVAITPMGFCYPGKASSGDKPPRPECALLWHGKLAEVMPNIGLTLLVGRYAQVHYLGSRGLSTLSETVQAWRNYLPNGYLPLPHPSPRNQPWFVRNPWFDAELVPELRAAVRALWP